MTLQNATVFGARWGPEPWQMFSYYANPNRDPNGNPCIVHRHGGGGWAGMALGFADGDILSGFVEYLLDPTREVHFDFVSAQTCQQYIDQTAGYFPRTSRHNMFDNIIDHKRMVCGIKAWGSGALGQTDYKIDPIRIITCGHSFGATTTGLSMITPPITYPTAWPLGARRIYEPQQFNSTPLGVLYFSGQVDFRTRMLHNAGDPTHAGVLRDYLDYSAVEGIFGTRSNDTHVQWDNVPTNAKESFSLLAHLENYASREFYKPMFTLYQDYSSFDHLYPLTQNHDSQMGVDLNLALDRAGLTYTTALTPDGTDPGPTSAANNAAIYSWASELVE